MLHTIQKASEVLALYSPDHAEWGVREVAERLQIAKSSAQDMLSSLAQIGFLNRTDDGRYRLGWRLVAMSDLLRGTTELCQEARPVLQELAEAHRETIQLAVLNDTKIVILETLECKQPVRVELASIHSHIYPHNSAVGKTLLAFRTRADVDRILQTEGLHSLTPNTITSRAQLYTELEKIRRQGYAYDLEETLLDLCGIGAPIYNHAGRVAAAISMLIPVYRFLRRQADYRAGTVSAAKQISEQLGYSRSAHPLLDPGNHRPEVDIR